MAKTKKEAEAKAPEEKKDQRFINFFRNPKTEKSTLQGPFQTPSGKDYFTSDYKDGQRVMIPGKLVKAKKDGTGYFVMGNEDFMANQKIAVSAKGEGKDAKYEKVGEISLADYADYRDEANQKYRDAKAAADATEETVTNEADGPDL